MRYDLIDALVALAKAMTKMATTTTRLLEAQAKAQESQSRRSGV
jgi:hypothetical protein